MHLESVYIHKKELIQVLEYFPSGNLLDLMKKVIFNLSKK